MILPVHLVGFVNGYGNSDLIEHRFRSNAIHSSLFDTINIVSKDSLSYILQDYQNLLKDFDLDSLRGYGFWSWKPFILLEIFKNYPANSVFCYADIGCEFSKYGNYANQYFAKKALSEGLCVFSTALHQNEYCWSKAALLDFFDLQHRLLMKDQIQATCFYISKEISTIRFLEQWLKFAISDNFALSSDQIGPNESPRFIENRHDQSIFSLMCKKSKFNPILSNCFFGQEDYLRKMLYPIHCNRNKGPDLSFAIQSVPRIFSIAIQVKFCDVILWMLILKFESLRYFIKRFLLTFFQ